MKGESAVSRRTRRWRDTIAVGGVVRQLNEREMARKNAGMTDNTSTTFAPHAHTARTARSIRVYTAKPGRTPRCQLQRFSCVQTRIPRYQSRMYHVALPDDQSVPVFDQTIPAARRHFGSFQWVRDAADYRTLVCTQGLVDLFRFPVPASVRKVAAGRGRGTERSARSSSRRRLEPQAVASRATQADRQTADATQQGAILCAEGGQAAVRTR
jgi:hypothetical protein|eukprot:COSAG06_NODE_6276_length_3002_cov_3.266965_2_plen_212_part_00